MHSPATSYLREIGTPQGRIERLRTRLAALRLDPAREAAAPDRGGPQPGVLDIASQVLVSTLISMLVTALIMYGFIGADMRGSASVAQIWRMGMSISVLAPALIVPIMSYRIGVLMQKLQGAHDELDHMARRDALTGLLNRRGLERAAEEIWSSPTGRFPVASVVMGDIDRFKSVNDAYGHDVGDLALVHVAGILRDCVGAAGRSVARLGGEEFAVLLPGADLSAACLIAERLRAACEANPLRIETSIVPLTLSLGVASQALDKSSLRRLLGLADKALYQAKQEGRNCVRAAPAVSSQDIDHPCPPALEAGELASG